VSGRTVFVTGAYGLLGSWLAKALLARGDRVIALRYDDAPSALRLEGAEADCTVVRGSVTDGALMLRALEEHGVDTVFHLAAQTLVGAAREDPAATFDANVRGTWSVLEASRRLQIPRTVVAASDKAYGPQPDLPYREDTPLLARYPYEASKAAADLVARSYFHTYGVPVAVTRFANLYGGGDPNASRLVPEAVAAALAGRAPVLRSDGSPERDWLYVEDGVAAYLAIADALEAAPAAAAGEAFNAGSGIPVSVLDVVAAVCAAAGAQVVPDVRGDGVPAGEIDRQFVDAAKLRALTGWAPQVGLDEGLARTVDWYRERPGFLGP
jgi:CDP-glucose 4,6-dehydratase